MITSRRCHSALSATRKYIAHSGSTVSTRWPCLNSLWWTHCAVGVGMAIGSSSGAGQRFPPHNRTLGVGESTTVTHSSADWWDILLPLA